MLVIWCNGKENQLERKKSIMSVTIIYFFILILFDFLVKNIFYLDFYFIIWSLKYEMINM